MFFPELLGLAYIIQLESPLSLGLLNPPLKRHWLQEVNMDERQFRPNLIRALGTYVCTDPLRGHMSTRDQHTGEIEADLASTRLPQMCKPLLLTLPWTRLDPL